VLDGKSATEEPPPRLAVVVRMIISLVVGIMIILHSLGILIGVLVAVGLFFLKEDDHDGSAAATGSSVF
jgi:hypothetical protein